MLRLTSRHKSKWDSFDLLLVVVFALLGIAFLLWSILSGRSESLLYAGVFLAACSGLLIVGSVLFGSIAVILSIRLRSSESFQVFNGFIFFIILFTSSVFYPTEYAPQPIYLISLANPLTYIADIFRAGLLGLADPMLFLKVFVLTAESLILLILAVVMFNQIRV
jgi:ABC-type polysaccharide/polyol phosphate export permease